MFANDYYNTVLLIIYLNTLNHKHYAVIVEAVSNTYRMCLSISVSMCTSNDYRHCDGKRFIVYSLW